MQNFQGDILNATPDVFDYSECPLHWLVYSDKHYRHLEARLKDPNVRDFEGNTLLHVAAQSPENNPRTAQLLIERGADVNSTNLYGHTALHFAVASRKRDIVGFLIEAGASVDSKDLLGRTALHFSVCKLQSYRLHPVFPGEFDMWIVERLLRRPGICINPVDPMNETPLMWAVKERNPKAAVALLKKGANPDIPRLLDNRTALHEALYAQKPDLNIVFALLTHGAGIYCEDFLRNNAMDILIRKVLVGSDETLLFAKQVLIIIAFRYHIRESVWQKLEQIPGLYNVLEECCKEVRLMRKLIVYDNVTLHDLCLNCHQTRFGDPVIKIHVPAVEMLISGLFQIYYKFIDCHLSESDLSGVLEIIAEKSCARDLVPNSASRGSILYVIRRVYACSAELKMRLRRLKHSLRNSFD